MARQPNNVATFKLGHWETMVLSKALAFFAENSESHEAERDAAADFASILGQPVLATLMVEEV